MTERELNDLIDMERRGIVSEEVRKAPRGTFAWRGLAGQDLTPAERVLAVTLLGLPVSKEAA
jgi:hypothetical protein